MPNQPIRPDETWTPEVDRLLRQLGAAHPERGQPRRSSRPPRPERPPRPRPWQPTAATLPTAEGVWGRVLLGTSLAAGMTQWPYGFCGLSLAGYLAAAGVVLVAGAWAGYAAWRRRMGPAHVVAMALVLVGAALAALEVLPRLGYTPYDTLWRCG